MAVEGALRMRWQEAGGDVAIRCLSLTMPREHRCIPGNLVALAEKQGRQPGEQEAFVEITNH